MDAKVEAGRSLCTGWLWKAGGAAGKKILRQLSQDAAEAGGPAGALDIAAPVPPPVAPVLFGSAAARKPSF